MGLGGLKGLSRWLSRFLSRGKSSAAVSASAQPLEGSEAPVLNKASEYAKVDREKTVFSHYGAMIPGVGIAEAVRMRRAMVERDRAEMLELPQDK